MEQDLAPCNSCPVGKVHFNPDFLEATFCYFDCRGLIMWRKDVVTWPSAVSNFEFVWPEWEECLKVAYC